MEYSLCTDQREEEGRTEAQIGYLRMSEFFMYDSDPEKVETYRKAKNLFYEYYADELMEHAVERTDVPYKKGTVPVMHCRAKGDWLVDLSGFF